MSDWTQEEYESHLGLYWDDDWYGQNLNEKDGSSQSKVKESLSTIKKLIKSIKDQDINGQYHHHVDGKPIPAAIDLLNLEIQLNKTVDWRHFTYEFPVEK